MQILYDYQKAAGTTREAHGQKVLLPSMQIYSDLPREWPMARLAVSNKQINRLVRTFLWRRVTEQALHGSSFTDIPDQINQAYIGDLLLISESFAAPLSNLFAFVKNGHPACPFITQKQLALYASPRFWQYGLLAFIGRCCSFDNQHRDQGTGAAQTGEGKSQTTKEKMQMPLPSCALSSCPLSGGWSMESTPWCGDLTQHIAPHEGPFRQTYD